jgi:hypothetical protein
MILQDIIIDLMTNTVIYCIPQIFDYIVSIVLSHNKYSRVFDILHSQILEGHQSRLAWKGTLFTWQYKYTNPYRLFHHWSPMDDFSLYKSCSK